MSRDLTLDMVRSLYAEEPEPMALLLTIEAEGLDEPIRVCSEPEKIARNRYGLVSRGQEYRWFPFSFAWGGAGETEPSRNAQLVIANTDGRLSAGLRTVTDQPRITVEMVRAAEPDVVELAVRGAALTDADVEETKITGTIRPRDFAGEPACKARYVISRTPSLY